MTVALVFYGKNNNYQDCEMGWLFLTILKSLEVRTVASWRIVILRGHEENC